MSGTSMDGMDVAYCRIWLNSHNEWQYDMPVACTYAYSDEWKCRLSGLTAATAEQYAYTHVDYGHLIGRTIRKFLQDNHIEADFVASHGHTIFHQPERMFTAQVGDGAAIAAECGLPVVCDFRTMDVACGGQGAPLVPIGDDNLFKAYDYCLNIGGIMNISYRQNGKRYAYDICPANMGLNFFAGQQGMVYDKDGMMAQSGKCIEPLLRELNSLAYYSMSYPKSLGREWFEQQFLPVINSYSANVADIMNTLCHHMAYQLAQEVKEGSVLLTGGGAKNKYVVSLFRQYMPQVHFEVPPVHIIDYKEALIFAFLGVLRWIQQPNCLKEVTGAAHNVVGGAIYYHKEYEDK